MIRFARSFVPSIVVLVLLIPSPARASVFTWNPMCGNGWCDCCDCGVSQKCNNWNQPPSPAPQCPAFPSGSDDVLLTGSVAINCSAAANTIMQSGGTTTLTAGLTISDSATFAGPFDWQAGAIDRGSTGAHTVYFNGGLTISTPAAKTLAFFGVFEAINNATATWTGGDWTIGQVPGNSAPAIFTNAAAGTFLVQTDASILSTAFGLGRFHNLGTVRKTSAGVSTYSVEFNNDGLLEMNAGTFAPAAGTNTGHIALAGGTSFQVASGGSYNLNTGTTITGTGTVDVGGTGATRLYANGNVSISTLNVGTNGYLDGDGTATITNAMTWTGGSLTDSVSTNGVTRIAPGATLSITGPASKTTPRIMSIGGAATYSQGDLQLSYSGVTIESTGSFDVTSNGAMCCGKFFNHGLMTFEMSGMPFHQFVDLDNYGTIDLRSGVLDLNYATFNQYAGQTILDGGTLSNTIVIHGGQLTGNGAIPHINNASVYNEGGLINPGMPGQAGTISVGNVFVQHSGTLRIDLGGYTQGTEFDYMPCGDVLGVHDTLDVHLINGFIPAIGSTFQVLTSNIRRDGMFDNVIPPRDRGIQVVYGGADVTLVITRGKGDMNCDDLVDGRDIQAFELALFNPAAYNVTYPTCNVLNGDFTGDNTVDAADVPLFVLALLRSN